MNRIPLDEAKRQLSGLGDENTSVAFRDPAFSGHADPDMAVITVKHHRDGKYYGQWRFVPQLKLVQNCERYLDLVRDLIKEVKEENNYELGEKADHELIALRANVWINKDQDDE